MSDEKIQSIKGFNQDMTCRDFQFAAGETFTHDGDAIACKSGFHAVEGYPLEVLRYYPPATSRYFHVEQSGQLARHSEDSKVASTALKIGAELSVAGLIKLAVEYTTSRCKPIDPKSPAWSTEENGSAVESAKNGAATASGDSGAATASGYSGAATASGRSGAATASGRSGAATASGDSGAATASGRSGAATASGYSGAATASGYSGAATAGGQHSVAMVSGFYGKARGVEGAALFLVYRDDRGTEPQYGRILHAKAVIVGQDGIEPLVFYALNKNGDVVKAE
jgi:hypothetical protein